MTPSKPSYSTSKWHLMFSSIMAWAVIFVCAAGAFMGRPEAVSFGVIAVPAMVTLIATMLGIHRFAGSMDFRAANLPRDQPPEDGT